MHFRMKIFYLHLKKIFALQKIFNLVLFSSYGVDVQGVDLSTNMNAISLEYRKQMEPEVKHRCHFYIEDADKMEFPENFFDIVYR